MLKPYLLVAEPFDSATVGFEPIIKVVLVLILAMSVVTFFIYGLDKRLAVNGEYRISERALLWLCILFGGIGGFLGMRLFRHKTRKTKFRLAVPLLAVIQALLAVWLCTLL